MRRGIPARSEVPVPQAKPAAGYAVDPVDVADPAFSQVDLRDPDLLIMMGGPMGVYKQDGGFNRWLQHWLDPAR